MRRAFLAALLVGLAAASGCYSTAAKQGLYAVTGASARYSEIRSLGSPAALDRFKTVGVESFDASPLLGQVPPELVAEAQAAVVARLTETKMFESVVRGTPPAGGLLIRGRFMDYDAGGSALRAVGFGVDPFLTAQIELVDTAANQSIGVAMVTGTVKSAVRTGPKELADGVGKAVKGLVEHHHTKPAREEAAPSGEGAQEKKGFRLPWSK
ncbi:MAG: DUF4410 domain-containing protein [Planctomycetes bacterium]|nr:DUF4410 domain-containing protein [Planctomycetota bacterium]